MRRTRRACCRYGSLTLLECLLAIAVPDAASGQTCDISATPPSPVQPGAWADLSAGCTGGPSLIQWSSSLASCSPLIGPNTVCNFPTEGTAFVSVSASYGSSFGGCFGAFDSSPVAVNAAAP